MRTVSKSGSSEIRFLRFLRNLPESAQRHCPPVIACLIRPRPAREEYSMRMLIAGFCRLTRSAVFGSLPHSTLKIDAKRAFPTRSSAAQRGPAPALAALLVLACLALLPGALHAQTVTATISVENDPVAVAVNPVTNTIYVANQNSESVTVIDGSTNNITTTVTVGGEPAAIAVDAVTNQVYVVNTQSDTVTVIDGVTNNTTTVNVGYTPDAVAVNPVTNKVYVANSGGAGSVTVIDGFTHNTTTVNVGYFPVAVAVNPVTNQVYVANSGNNTVTVIDGATNNTTTVNAAETPQTIALDPVTNMIYIANRYGNTVSANDGTVTVIDGATNNTATVNIGLFPGAIAVDPVTDTIWVVNNGGGTVTYIGGANNNSGTVSVGSVSFGGGSYLYGLAVNPVTYDVYVVDSSDGSVSAIDQNTFTTATAGVGSEPYALAVNPVTNLIYVASQPCCGFVGAVAVVDGAASAQAATTTALTTNANPLVPDSPVTFTATVSGASNSATPTGWVSFIDYAQPLGPVPAGTLIYPDGGVQIGHQLLNTNGVATCSTSTLAGGMHTVFAVYMGDASHASSSGELLEGVDLSPAITSAASALFVVSQSGSFTVTTTGVPAPALSVTSGTLPSGVSFVDNKNGTATLSGTPSAPPGTYPFTITASNGVGTAATQSFTLTLDQTPAITTAASAVFVAGQPGSFTVKATGLPTPSFSLTSGALPSGVSFVDNQNGTATMSGTTAAGSVGTYPITITASNLVGTATQSFSMVIGQAPAITSAASASFAFGVADSFTVTATGLPLPSLSVTSGALPSGLTFVSNQNGTATLSGTPTAALGTYPFTITAQNGVGTAATQSFTLTLGYGPAIVSAPTATFVVGKAGSFTVSATGYPTPAFSVSAGSPPSGVTLVDNGNGTATLSSTASAGPAGAYYFSITASNAVSTATQSFTLTLGQAPAFTSATSTTFAVGKEGYFALGATGTPAPVFTETGNLPSGVTFNPFYGYLSGVPAQGTTGDYAITFTANNGISPNATQQFVLTVGFLAPSITSTNNVTFTVGQSGSFTVTTSGTPRPTLSETYPLPSGIAFNPSTGVLSGTPAVGTVGTYPILFTAVNGINPGAVQDFTLFVAPSANTTSTTLAVSANPVTYGNRLSIAATVTPGSVAGTVAFFDDGIQFGEQALSGGSAVLRTTVLDAGMHYITANYMSNATSVGSSATIIETVNPAPLTATASSVFMVAGGEVPEILPEYKGLVNNATPSSLTKQPTCSTTATPTSPPGTYRSSCSGGVDKNYRFSYVSGTVTVYKPAASVSPTLLSFGTQAVDTRTASKKVTVSNTADGPLTVKGIGLSGTDEADFAESDTCGKLPATLAAKSSCTISVTFTPRAKGSRSAVLSLATGAGTKTVPLSGTGK
jgi:YVTN family beta-propeller protein